MSGFVSDLLQSPGFGGVDIEKIEVSDDRTSVRFFLRLPVFDSGLVSDVREALIRRFPQRRCLFDFTFAPGP